MTPPYNTAQMALRSAEKTTTVTVVAAWPEYTKIRDLDIQLGRFFSQNEEISMARVLILGHETTKRLFKRPEDVLGRTVYLGTAGYRIIGVVKKGRDLSGDNQDEQAFMPLSTYLRRVANQN